MPKPVSLLKGFEKAVATAKANKDKKQRFFDPETTGLALIVTTKGKKSFAVAARDPDKKLVWRTIGDPAKMTVAEAREKAVEEVRCIKTGEVPKAPPKPFTVAKVLDRFIEEHAKPNLADKTWSEYERLADKIIKLEIGEKAVDELTPTDVAAMRDKYRSTATQAAAAVRALSSALSWAEEAGLRSHGPNVARIRLKATRRRERLFSAAEVARLQAKISEFEADEKITKAVALALRLLFATGCRAGEICGLEWSNVDFDEGLLRWLRSKTGHLEKPLTAEARKLLKAADRIVGCNYVCPSSELKALRVDTLEAAFEKIMAAAHVEAKENATLHLIRHWFATVTYTDESIPLPVQMAIVGHSSVATAMRYAHVSRDKLKKAAGDAAKRRAASVRAASKRGKVVRLPRAGGARGN
jgi:integrase